MGAGPVHSMDQVGAGSGVPRPAPAGLPFPYYRRFALNGVAMIVGQTLTLAGCLLLGGLVRQVLKGDPMITGWLFFLLLAWIAGASVVRLVPGWGLGPSEELRRTTIVLLSLFAGMTVMLFWGKAAEQTSRLALTIGFAASLVLVPFSRTQVKRVLIRMGRWGVPTAVYADAVNGPRVIRSLMAEPGLGYNPAMVFSDDLPADHRLEGVPVVGSRRENTAACPVAVYAIPEIARANLTALFDGPLASYRKVVIIPEWEEAPSILVHPRDFLGMLGLEVSSNLLDPMARVTKRAAELALVLVTAPAWVPLGLALAVAVWLEDRGHPLFLQSRVGRHGRLFRTWKFRTMRPDAEAALREALDRDPDLRAEWAMYFKLRRDPRTTRVGAFLRRTSLDELPQLVNVLAGDMSLIGPRPLPRYHHDGMPETIRRLRERVRPGITGLWQVSGRTDAGAEGMARWDSYYVRNWSIWLDIIVLFRTFKEVLSGRGAY